MFDVFNVYRAQSSAMAYTFPLVRWKQNLHLDFAAWYKLCRPQQMLHRQSNSRSGCASPSQRPPCQLSRIERQATCLLKSVSDSLGPELYHLISSIRVIGGCVGRQKYHALVVCPIRGDGTRCAWSAGSADWAGEWHGAERSVASRSLSSSSSCSPKTKFKIKSSPARVQRVQSAQTVPHFHDCSISTPIVDLTGALAPSSRAIVSTYCVSTTHSTRVAEQSENTFKPQTCVPYLLYMPRRYYGTYVTVSLFPRSPNAHRTAVVRRRGWRCSGGEGEDKRPCCAHSERMLLVRVAVGRK